MSTKLEEDGPDAYFATLPVQAMVDACKEKGVPANVSYSAGTYCCNEVLYELLYALDHRHPGVRGGFVHVPYLDSQAANLKAGTPSMSLARITEGLTAMVPPWWSTRARTSSPPPPAASTRQRAWQTPR